MILLIGIFVSMIVGICAGYYLGYGAGYFDGAKNTIEAFRIELHPKNHNPKDQ